MKYRRQDREVVRTVSLRLREKLDTIDDAIDDAQDLLGELEEAAGLVRDDGSRIDEETLKDTVAMVRSLTPTGAKHSTRRKT